MDIHLIYSSKRNHNMTEMKPILIFISFLVVEASLCGQNNLTWFQASSMDDASEIRVSSDCVVEKESTDSGLNEIEFKPRQFFVYTHPQIRQYMTEGYLMECMANVQKVEDNTFLILEYKINSEKAKLNYGNLEKGGKIRVDLSNRDHVYLENIERSRGKVRRTDKYTSYTGTYAINKDNVNLLKKHYIDRITVLWEEGVETYEIQNVDLVKNQLIYLAER